MAVQVLVAEVGVREGKEDCEGEEVPNVHAQSLTGRGMGKVLGREEGKGPACMAVRRYKEGQ